MTKTEMMKEIERLTAELDEARRDRDVAKNNLAEAVRTLKELKSAFGDAGDWLRSVMGQEIARCESKRKDFRNWDLSNECKRAKALRKIEELVIYIRGGGAE